MPTTPELPDIGPILEHVQVELGVCLEPESLALEWRDWRWMAVIPEAVVLVAPTAEAWARLGREAALMVAARAVVGPQIARILLEEPRLSIQVRERLSGLHGHAIEARILGTTMEAAPRYAPECPLTRWGEAFAEDLGRTLARFHRAMTATDGRAAGFLPYRIDWVEVERVLHALSGLEAVARAARAARAWDEARAVEDVVIHGDPHLFNVFAADEGCVSGLVDFGDAAVGERAKDLRYLHSHGPRFTRIAVDAYAGEARIAIDPEVVARHHVCSAFEHFASWELMTRQGRTSRIVEWTSAALDALVPAWIR